MQTDMERQTFAPTPANDSLGPPSASPPMSTFGSEMGRVSRQSSIAFAGTVFTVVLGSVFKIYLARALGVNLLGLYALGMTIIGLLGVVNVLGLPDAAMRFVAQYVAERRPDSLAALLWNGSWILLASNLGFVVILLKAGPWIAVRIYRSPPLVPYLPLFGAIMISGALTSFFGKVIAGYKEIGRRTLITRFVATPLTMAIAVAVIAFGGGLRGYLLAQIVSASIVLALLVRLAWRLTPPAARSFRSRRLSLGSEVWSFSAAMFGVGLMEFLMSQADRVALGFFRGVYDVGIYSVAASVIAYETVFLQSVNQIFAPVIADLHTRGEIVLLGRMFQTLTKWTLGLTCPLAIVLIVFAHPGDRYLRPVDQLRSRLCRLSSVDVRQSSAIGAPAIRHGRHDGGAEHFAGSALGRVGRSHRRLGHKRGRQSLEPRGS
jgi:O-antigen/teichoic acid export membrane protein